MGDCAFCGKPAGFLRKEHKECRQRFEAGKELFLAQITSAVSRGTEPTVLETELTDIARSHFISDQDFQSLLVQGWEQAVAEALDDHILSDQEEERLKAVTDHFGLQRDQLDSRGILTKLVKAAILRELAESELPTRITITGQLPFNFQKSETLIWVFQGVEHYELRTQRRYAGTTSGVNVRVAKGVYLRSGAFEGHPVDRTELVHIGTGILAVTDKHLYFSGGPKIFRIQYGKILALEPASDGVTIQRDATTAKPQTFVTGDGWFTYNLLRVLCQR